MVKKIINKSLTFILDVFMYAFLASILNFVFIKIGFQKELLSATTELIIGLVLATFNFIYKWSKGND